jgi:hypothetical protein
MSDCFTYSNTLFYFLRNYVQPIFRDIGANISNHRHIGAEQVEFLPIPSRSVSGIMSFNPTQGTGLFESLANRALLALPLLVIGFWGSGLAKENLMNAITQPAAVNGELGLTNRSSAPISGQISTADSWSDPLSASKLVDQYQLGWFWVTIAPVYLIWLMEANRRANYLKPIQLYVPTNPERPETENYALLTRPTRTLIFGLLAQTNRSDLWANIWFVLHFVQSPIEVFAPADQRLLNMNYARALLPTVLLSYVAPLLVLVFCPDTAISEHLTSMHRLFRL